MANILIVAENMRYRHELADVLTAAGHHVVTTSDSVLALAALRVSQRRFIVLLSEGIGRDELAGRDILDIIARDEIDSSSLALDGEPIQHAYILLTRLSPDGLPEGLRALHLYGRATTLDPNCSIGSLLAAVDLAGERLAPCDAMQWKSTVPIL